MRSKSESRKKSGSAHSGDAGDKDRLIAELKDQVAVLENELRRMEKAVASQDAAERERMERELNLMQFSVEKTSDEIFWMDSKGRVIYVNDATCRILGYSRDEMLSMYVWDFDPTYSSEIWLNSFNELKKKRSQNFETKHKTREGVVFPVEITANYVEYGGKAYSFAFVRDITERKRAEEALLESKEKYRYLVENANSIIIRWDLTGNFTFFNEFAEEFFGYSASEVLGKNVMDTIVPAAESTGRDLTAMIQDIERHPERYTTNLNENIRRNGERVWISWTNKAILDAHGNTVEILSVGNDFTERKRAEEIASRLASIVTSSDDAIIGKTIHGIITSWNQGAERLYGYSAGEAVGNSIGIIVPPDREQELWDVMARIRRGARVKHLETERVTKDGRRIDVAITISPILDASGNATGASTIARDISERKRVEKDLRLTQFSVDRAADIALWVAPDGRFIYANDVACKAFGYTREEFLSLKAFDTNPYFNEKNWGEHWKEVKERGSFTIEAMLRRKDGSSFPGEITVNYLLYDGKEYNCSYIRDITERKRAEAALVRDRYILTKSQEAAKVGNWAWDLETSEFSGSMENYRIWGYEPNAAKPTTDWVLTHVLPEDRTALADFMDAEAQDGRRGSIDYRIMRPDGSVRYVNTIVDKAVRDKAGNVKRLYGITQDITERKRAEEALKSAKHQADLYVDLMGHDINNMNQVSLGFLELARNMIEMDGRLDRDNIVLLDKAMNSLMNSSLLIDNVRKLQREKSGHYAFSCIDLDGLLWEIRDHYSSVPNRDVTIDYESRGSCTVQANELIRDVFVNLVGNAIKHSNSMRKLAVGIRTEMVKENGADYCRVSVEDNGPGIPDELKAKLFDRLNLDSTRAKGKGFGLCLIKMLVDDYQGKFWVEDRVPGDYKKGARFVVMLPAIEN